MDVSDFLRWTPAILGLWSLLRKFIRRVPHYARMIKLSLVGAKSSSSQIIGRKTCPLTAN